MKNWMIFSMIYFRWKISFYYRLKNQGKTKLIEDTIFTA